MSPGLALDIFLLSLLLTLQMSHALPSDPGKVYRSILHSKSLPNLTPHTILPLLLRPGLLPTTSSCLSRLQSMANHFLTDPTFSILLGYSSRQLNDMGMYKECEKQGAYYNLLFGIIIGEGVEYRVGLCMPKECSVEVIAAVKPEIARLISSAFGTPVGEDKLLLIDTREFAETFSRIWPSTAVFLVVSAVLLATIAVVSVLDYRGAFPKNSDAVWTKALVCFSVQRNIGSLMNTENRVDGKLEVLNGIRVWSICWVVIGHVFEIMMMEGVMNLEDVIYDIDNSFFIAIIKAGVLAVDVFFFLSGFLAALVLCRSLKNPRNRTAKTIVFAYVHRYVRLLPLMMVCSFLIPQILPMLYDNPMLHLLEAQAESCKNRMYQNLLYASNFLEPLSRTCTGWVWYLTNDMQMFLFMPFIALLYIRNKRLCLAALGGISVISLAVQIALCYKYNFSLSYSHSANEADQEIVYYIKPYCRVIPYIQGVFLYFLYEDGKQETGTIPAFQWVQKSVHDSRALRIFLYVFGGVALLLPVYSFYFIDRYPELWGKAFGIFQMLSCRPVFILGLSLLILPVLVGRGKQLLAFLGHPSMNVLGKLTYGTYMLHIPVIVWGALSAYQGRVYTIVDNVFKTSGFVAVSYLAAFVVDIVYESPVAQLLRLIMGPRTRGGKDKEKGETKTIKAETETGEK